MTTSITVEGKSHKIVWADIIPTLCGYSSGCEHHEDGSITPAVFETREEAQADHDDMASHYEDEILEGDRDEDDEWEGIVTACYVDGEKIVLLDENNNFAAIESFKWLD